MWSVTRLIYPIIRSEASLIASCHRFSSVPRRGFKNNKDNKTPPLNDKLVKILLRRRRVKVSTDVTVRLILDETSREEVGDESVMKNMQVTTLDHAMAMAKEHVLDLVGVDLGQDPPVVKAINYRKTEYDKMKAAKQKMKERKEKGIIDASVKLPTKEFKFRAGIADNDLLRKIDNMKKYLTKGHKCQVTITSALRYRREDQNVVDTTMNRVLENVTELINEPQGKKGNLTYKTCLLTPKRS